MSKEDFVKKKKYGQNFLSDPAIIAKIVDKSGIDKTCGVLEIGPGAGSLTSQLSKSAAFVVSVEIDEALMPLLYERFSDFENVKFINADILKTDVKALINKYFCGMKVCVCANIPYYITSPIIMALLESNADIDSITVTMQKEAAERFCAKKNTVNYGAVTAAVNYYADVKKLFNISAGSFSPKPKVDSSVVKFEIYKQKPVSVISEDVLFEVIRAAFAQRRKTLVNSLHSVFNAKLNKDEICDILKSKGFSETVRGEELDVLEFALIADSISQKEKNNI